MATHDYVIDNSTGANVRADINNVLQAILTNNSSSSAPSTTAAYMWWADTSNGILKIRNSANSAWVELFQLDGTLTLENGSVSTPALAFRDDLNTGIFQSGNNDFKVAVAGIERLSLEPSITTFNEDGEDTDFKIEGDSLTNLFYVNAGLNQIGIGTDTPDQLLHLSADGNGPFIRFENTDTSVSAAQTFGGFEFESRDASTGSAGVIAKIDCISSAAFDGSSANGGELRFHTSGTNSISLLERMRLLAGGNLLLGSSSNLSVASGTTGLLQLTRTSGAVHQSLNLFTNDTSGSILAFGKSRGTSAGSYTIVQSGDELGTIRFAGADGTDLVPIGASITAIVDGTPGSNSMPGRLIFSTNGGGTDEPTERLRIGNNGYMSLGTGTDGVDSQYRFHIKSTTFGLLKLETTLTGADGPYLEMKHTSTSPADNDQLGIIQFKGKNSADEDNTYGYLMFRSIDVTDGTEDGELQIVTQNGGVPAARLTVGQDGAITAGSGNFVVGNAGRGLQFNALDSGSNELLDDYEEATYTPTITYGTSDDGNKVYTSQGGNYTKIGRKVQVNININLSNRGTGSGRVNLSLPFAVADSLPNTSFEAGGVVYYFQSLLSSVTTLNTIAQQGSSFASIRGTMGSATGNTQDFTYGHLSNTTELRATITYFTAT